jgi:indole-3-glycerol phosphate synthase
VIAEDFDAVALARAYEAAGAHCLSVLTDETFFQGSLTDLTLVRRAVELPCLRKDFIVHEAQIYEAAVAGADCVLLIVAALEQPALEHLYDVACRCSLDVLVEVHDMAELERAIDLGAEMIGINNRNLTTFEVHLETTERLSEEVPDGVLLVAESGLKTRADARRMFDAGCNALLVGESLVRSGVAGIPMQVETLLGCVEEIGPQSDTEQC